MAHSTVTREAPPGPTMTEAEFKVAMEQLAQDAARWRWLRRNWSRFVEESVLPLAAIPSGAQIQQWIDEERAK